MKIDSAVLVLSSIAIAIYLPIVVIAWRNVGFSAPWKQLFALSVLPVFVLGMIFNIWVSANFAPWLFDFLGWAKNTDKLVVESRIGFLIAVPIALLITAFWYLLLRSLDRATKNQELK